MQIRAILMLTLRTLFNNYQHIFKSAVKMVVFDLSKNRPLMCASTPKTSSTLDKTPEQQLIGLSKRRHCKDCHWTRARNFCHVYQICICWRWSTCCFLVSKRTQCDCFGIAFCWHFMPLHSKEQSAVEVKSVFRFSNCCHLDIITITLHVVSFIPREWDASATYTAACLTLPVAVQGWHQSYVACFGLASCYSAFPHALHMHLD